MLTLLQIQCKEAAANQRSACRVCGPHICRCKTHRRARTTPSSSSTQHPAARRRPRKAFATAPRAWLSRLLLLLPLRALRRETAHAAVVRTAAAAACDAALSHVAVRAAAKSFVACAGGSARLERMRWQRAGGHAAHSPTRSSPTASPIAAGRACV